MRLEVHILQNFAPSNLNREDTGSPKSCEFGGYRRARVSSQCQKRAIREFFKTQDLIDATHRAQRTRRLAEEVSRRLVARGKPEAAATRAADAAVSTFLPKSESKEGALKTPYLLFLSDTEIGKFADLVNQHFDAFSADAAAVPSADEKPAKKRGKAKAEGPKAPEGFQKAAEALLDGGAAADLALFGRMLADLPERNVDAACQVAHALSTNTIHTMEMDYYTAVDDLKPNDTAGADMIGTVEFNSACFYRYANLDLGQLAKNLPDAELRHRTVAAFLQALIHAIPTGKQNSFAAHNPPSLVFVLVGDATPVSLANAFVRPVRVRSDESLIEKSMRALDEYQGRIHRMLGGHPPVAAAFCALEDVPCAHLGERHDSVDGLIHVAVQAATSSPEAS